MINNEKLYPLLFEPVLKAYVWGGRSLERLFRRSLPPGPIAESWEIAAHPNGTTKVINGPHRGKSLAQLQSELGTDLVGRRSEWALRRDKFPLLIKVLDAQEPLSVQVHPNDDYALKHEGNELGKTEMWVVLHAEPEAAVILGVKAGTTPHIFRQALEAGDLEPLLHRLPLQRGDSVCVPAGSLHAILGGLVIAEIQQNSDTTYRVYDWNRQDLNRPLHIRQSLEVINFNQVEPTLSEPHPLPAPEGVRAELLCHNRYFAVERLYLESGAKYEGRCNGTSLEIWGCVSGAVIVHAGGAATVDLPALRFSLLPAAMGSFHIIASNEATLLRIYTPH